MGQQNSEEWISIVKNQVESLKFGTVQITVHNGSIVQIDRTEKWRLEGSKDPKREGPEAQAGTGRVRQQTN